MNTDLILAIAAISAVATSIVSIIYTVIFSRQQMKHNRNSVRPICDIKFKDYEDCISVSISNVGTGPLTIKKIVCDDTERTSSTLLSLMPHIEQYWTTYTEDVTGWTIPVGGQIVLIEIKPQNESIRHQIRSSLEKINIFVKYTDIYDTFFEKSRNLDFFGRNLDTSKRYIKSHEKNNVKNKQLN